MPFNAWINGIFLALVFHLASPATAAPEPQLGEVKQIGTTGPVLLLIPCMSCRWKSFAPFMERNKDKFRMYAVTLPGFAMTPAPKVLSNSNEPLWHRNAVTALSNLIDREKLKDIHVVGHSFGATIALRLAHQRPDAIAGLVNVDGFWLAPKEQEEWTEQQRIAFAKSTMEKYAYPLRNSPDQWQAFNIPGITDRKIELLHHGWFMSTNMENMFQYWRENMLSYSNEFFRDLKMPVLELKNFWPDSGDFEAQRKAHEESWAQIGKPANLQLVYLYDTAHFTMHERPGVFDQYIADFVAGRKVSDFRPTAK